MNRKQIIQQYLEQHLTMKEIGRKLGVSRQRIYQLMTRYNLQTPEVKRHGFWRTQTIPQQWLWRHLCRGNISRFGRLSKDTKVRLYNELKEQIPIVCPIFNQPLDFNEQSSLKRNPWSPSLDRINSAKGYISNNIQIISWKANSIKNSGTSAEHRQIADYLDSLDKIKIDRDKK